MAMKSNSGDLDEGVLDDNETEQLDTQIEWLCSVANDCRRVTEEAMISQCKISDSHQDNPATVGASGAGGGGGGMGSSGFLGPGLTAETLQIARVSDKAYDSFSRVSAKAIDFVSCIIFKTLFGVVDECRVFDKDVFKRWKNSLKTLPQNMPPGGESRGETRSNLLDLDFLFELIEEKCEYLQPFCHYRLLSLCADKVVMVYLHLLKDAKNSNRIFSPDGIEISQLTIDVTTIQNLFKISCRHKDLKNYADAILQHLRPLKHAISLISLSRNSVEFEKVLDTLYKVNPFILLLLIFIEFRLFFVFLSIFYFSSSFLHFYFLFVFYPFLFSVVTIVIAVIVIFYDSLILSILLL